MPQPRNKPVNLTLPRRYEEGTPCAECGSCSDGQFCEPARQPMRDYCGIRFTSDGFDCALPVSIDSHSHCSYTCLYCFSDNLAQHRAAAARPIGQTSLKELEAIFSKKPGVTRDAIRNALKYDRPNKDGYPCAVQLGAICDPMDNIERQQGWLLELIKLAIKYQQPVRISTKGNLAMVDEYIDAFSQAPELFWVAFSIISPDDKLMAKVDLKAPSPTERIACMERLSDAGVSTSLRFRPIMPGLSDYTKEHPKAYKDLIDMAAEAGAKAISYEVAYVPGHRTAGINARWQQLEDAAGMPYRKIYAQFGPKQACTRPSAQWTEGIMWAIAVHAKRKGLVIGVSDPTWKQLTETGCCCGILPDDKVFGNWQRESATEQLRALKAGEKQQVWAKDIIPAWARDVLLSSMVNLGPGPTKAYQRRHVTWADKLELIWNDLKNERGPLQYFQGAIVPSEITKDGQVAFKYRGLRKSGRTEWPYWRIE